MINLLKRIYKYVKMKNRGIDTTFKSTKHATLNGANYGKNVGLYDVEYVEKGTSIGDYSYLNSGCMLISGSIGRFCSIGYRTIIGPNEHPIKELITHPVIYDNGYKFIQNNKKVKFSQKKAPIIEDNVWIGANCVIMNGVTIGEGSVIGANSVVTKDIPPYSVAVGMPAKVLKNRKEEFDIEDIKLKNMTTDEIINYINKH
ncbi:MAG: CatB-related O-acetyltransferase [Romboutsia sp.]